MDPFNWALLAGAVVLAFVLGGTIAWLYVRKRNARRLHKRFGPEYDRVVEQTGDRQQAEHELTRREERVRGFDIRSLSSEQRSSFGQAWRSVQASFVDAPVRAVSEADELVTEVMHARGYPMSDFDRRAEDLSVDHPRVIENYRAAHALAQRSDRGEANTEDLRQAMVHYRALFEDLLEATVTDSRAVQSPKQEVRR